MSLGNGAWLALIALIVGGDLALEKWGKTSLSEAWWADAKSPVLRPVEVVALVGVAAHLLFGWPIWLLLLAPLAGGVGWLVHRARA